jgi:short-subunit dehydrogenase
VTQPELAVVTGASSGIGEALARRLAEEGRDLLLVARSGDRLESLAEEVARTSGIEAGFLAADLGKPEGREAVFAVTEGAGRIVSILVNGAGFGLNGPEAELPLERVLGMLQLNFVLSFTHALHEEAKKDGVTVTCLCPGYTKTNFYAVAGMRGAEATPFPEMTPDAVATIGLEALRKKKPYVVTHPLDRAWIASGRLVPRSVPVKLSAAVFSRTRLPK